MYISGVYYNMTESYEIEIVPKYWNIDKWITNPLSREGIEKQDCSAWSFLSTIDCKTYLQKEHKVSAVNALIIDYDSPEMSIEKAKDIFKKYKFYLYTTWSHLTKNNIHKFRVILPLDIPCLYEEYVKYRPAFKKHFSYADKTTFDRSRKMFMPYCSDNYEYFINEGELYSLNAIKETYKYMNGFKQLETTEKLSRYLSNDFPEADYRVCERQLDDILRLGDNSGRYEKIRSWLYFWCKRGDRTRVYDIFNNSNYNERKNKEILLKLIWRN